MSKGNYKKKNKSGRKPLPAYKKKIRVIVFVSEEDVDMDGGKKAFEESIKKEFKK